MIGGGPGSFIGAVHRMAANLDGQIELVCGAFSSDPAKSSQTGRELFLNPDRVYPDFATMIQKEKNLSPEERMDFVSIVTPNHVHFAPAKMALEHGFHVVCDKPMTHNLEEAYELREVVRKSGLVFALTHTYSGYPMVKQAKAMLENGELGKIRKVVVEYPQGWLSTLLEVTDSRQASWRTDPARSGIAGAMGDIGTHAEHLAEYITGLKIEKLCADISTLVEGRRLDDDGNVLLRFDNGARGVLYASQISAGEENNLRIRVYGEKGSLDWSQMEPNTLTVRWLDKPIQILRTGSVGLYPVANAHTRVPSGHPEGYLEAFANIYRNVAHHIRAYKSGQLPEPMLDFPGVEEGVRGMEFIYKVIESGRSEQKWI
ncbi:MAG: Gfo/Idh/MocA family oxidoreductase [Saprospiraceae bacterium]|nr:Gfo/Idh/MocA family oxidoreductase [Saprospiraceae bacterium]